MSEEEKSKAEEMMDDVAMVTETVAGLRNALINEGFPSDVAESIIVEQMRMAIAGMELETARLKADRPGLSDLFGRMTGG